MTTQRVGRLDTRIENGKLVLGGRFDDGITGLEILASRIAGDVVVDLEGVTFVNSIGMREWLRLVRALRERGTVTLERVADVLMAQMNLIPELAGVHIVSFHAQYACPACGAEAAPLIDAVANLPALRRMEVPPQPCPECGAAMELAEFPERYLTIFRP